MLFQLGYVSTASANLRPQDLVQILTRSGELNARDNLTGLLLLHGQHFLQVLEGEEALVRATFERIRRDERHHGISVLFEHTVEVRENSDWHSDLLVVEGKEWQALPGLEGHPKSLRQITADLGHVKQLLTQVRQSGLGRNRDNSDNGGRRPS